MEKNTVAQKVLEWVSKEGYPLEFKTANVFRENGFTAYQGRYVDDFKTGQPREIDVDASITYDVDGAFLRMSYIVESKWSDDKPWVIFTDSSSRISPGACIAQSISTKSVDACLFYLASRPDIQCLSIFDVPVRPGFNGRQAFSNQNDLVYSTLKSVVSACYSEKLWYEKGRAEVYEHFGLGVLLLPLIVIQGKLFESYYNQETAKLEVEERSSIRLHWKGSDAWKFHSTVDVVTIDALPDYILEKSREIPYLMSEIAKIFLQVKASVNQKSLRPMQNLMIERGSDGKASIPYLLHYLIKSRSGAASSII